MNWLAPRYVGVFLSSHSILLPSIVALFSLLSVSLFAIIGWPGEFVGAGSGFCEEFRETTIRQPANTWSNLGFIVTGVWLVRVVKFDVRESYLERNLIVHSQPLAVLYATLVVLLGAGSMAMHASGTDWGGMADVLSMMVYIAFPLSYAVSRVFRLGAVECARIYVFLAGAFGFGLFSGLFPASGSFLYGVFIPLFVGMELFLVFRNPRPHNGIWWLVVTGTSFLIGLMIWNLSHTGGPLCDGRSLLQGHAVWHLLCAVSTASLFFFYRSENRT